MHSNRTVCVWHVRGRAGGCFEIGNLKIQGGDCGGRNNTHQHEYLKSSYLKFESGEFSVLGAWSEAVISAGGRCGLFFSFYNNKTLFNWTFLWGRSRKCGCLSQEYARRKGEERRHDALCCCCCWSEVYPVPRDWWVEISCDLDV